jgi:hypothetical protein
MPTSTPAAATPTAVALTTASIGRPITRAGVSLFPVYLHQPAPHVVTGTAAGLGIGELPAASVPTVRFENHGTDPVLVPAGTVVTGGQQNRVVNVSVLVPAATTLDVPVSCVEQGRWSGASSFGLGAAYAPRRVRRTNGVTVERNLREHGVRGADQSAIWSEVHAELGREGVQSATGDLEALHRGVARDGRRRDAITELVTRGPLPGQCGVVVAHGGRVVAADVFASATLLATAWEAVVRSHLAERPAVISGTPSVSRALHFLTRFALAAAHEGPGAGVGRERHVSTDRVAGQALELDTALVHASWFALAA